MDQEKMSTLRKGYMKAASNLTQLLACIPV